MSDDRETLQSVLRSFRQVNRMMGQTLREEAELHDLTAIQILVLRVLYHNPDIGLNELADSLQLGNSTMSGVVDRLVSAGLVVRERDPEDRRTLIMHLTPAGRAEQEEVFGDDTLMAKRFYRILDIPEEDLAHLFTIHEQILEKLQQEGDEETNEK